MVVVNEFGNSGKCGEFTRSESGICVVDVINEQKVSMAVDARCENLASEERQDKKLEHDPDGGLSKLRI